MQPALTLAEIRREAHAVIPGATLTPHALWRYSLLWTTRYDASDSAAVRQRTPQCREAGRLTGAEFLECTCAAGSKRGGHIAL